MKLNLCANRLVKGGVLLVAALVAGHASARPDAWYVNATNYTQFCNSNESLLKEAPRGIVLEFPGLDGGSCLGGWQDPLAPYVKSGSGFPEETAKAGLLHLYLTPGAWSWMNPGVVRLTDLVVDAARARFSLGEGTPLVATGGSMGGLGALVYAARSRHRVTSVAAACPCYDVPALYGCRREFARTFLSAVARMDVPFEEGLRAISPAHLVDRMPDVPYLVVCDEADELFPAKGMDDYVASLRQAGRTVEYLRLPGMRHGEFSAEARQRLHDFVCGAAVPVVR